MGQDTALAPKLRRLFSLGDHTPCFYTRGVKISSTFGSICRKLYQSTLVHLDQPSDCRILAFPLTFFCCCNIVFPSFQPTDVYKLITVFLIQLRSLIYKVLDHGRFHYRSLTDSEEPLSLANKSSVIFSDIDDDEYLLELVRGGDAILDDQIDAQPSGRLVFLQLILVICRFSESLQFSFVNFPSTISYLSPPGGTFALLIYLLLCIIRYFHYCVINYVLSYFQHRCTSKVWRII